MAEGGFEKKLKARELVAIGLGAVVGWSWIVYGGLWSTVGGSLGGVLAFFITGLLCCLVGLVYAELTSAYPKAGGDIVFAFEGLGVKASLVTMWCMLVFWIGLIMIECMMIPVIMSRLGFAIPQICPLYDIAGGTVYLSYVVVSLLFNLLFAFLNVKGTQLASGVQTAAVYLLLAGAVFLAVSGFLKGDVANAEPLFTDMNGFVSVFLMLPGFMAGFNAIPQAAEEAKAPPKIIGKMVIATVWAAVIFYVMVIVGTSLGAPESVRLGDDLVVLDAFGLMYNNNPVVMTFICFVSLLGMLTSWNAAYMAASRMIVGLARAKYLPGSLAHVNEKTGTPSKVIWLLFAFTSLILIFGSSQTVYVLIVDVFSFGLVVVWLLVSIAFLRLRKLRPTLERPYRIKHPALIGWGSILFCIWFLYLYMPFGPAGLTNAEWATIGAVAVLALIVYFGWNRRGGKIPDEERRDLFGISQK